MTGKLPDYIKDARFINEEVEVDRSHWPRDPSVYTPSDMFVQRFKETGSTIIEDDITGAFLYGGLYEAVHNCVAFVNNLGGVAIYVVVGIDGNRIYLNDLESNDYAIVTLWAHVHDRDEAWATGRWTGQDLNKIDEMKPTDNWDKQL